MLTLLLLRPVRTGSPGYRNGPMLVVGRPRVLDISNHVTHSYIDDCEDVLGDLAGRD